VRVQDPIRIEPDDMPEPDLAIVRIRPDAYRDGHPTPEDIRLIVEASDTSLVFDRGTKLRLYARAGIREVWIVNLGSGRIEMYREPRNGRYRRVDVATRGGTLTPESFPNIIIPVDEILGA
jgi:Uma2 family endonuclease